MMNRLIRILGLSLILLAANAASALDLPVKNVNGKPYYYYTVKKGDTVYSLIARFGITRAQLVESNPAAADMLKTGDTLYFAVDKFSDGKPVVIEADDAKTQPSEQGIVYHQVRKGETLYGISKKYNVDQEQIVALNPKARFGVKTGSTLRIPVSAEYTAAADTAAGQADVTSGNAVANAPVATSIEVTAELTPVNPPIERAPDNYDAAIDDTEDITDSIAVQSASRPASIAVLLPFMLDSETPGRQALHYTDFYKGLLLAADTLSNRGDSLKIFTYDTAGDLSRVKELLSDTNITGASVIIAPDESSQLAAIADAVTGSDTKIINVFNVRDSLFTVNPLFIQTNTPHSVMYNKAMQAISQLYPSHIPVILRNENGRNDKAEFITYLTAEYNARGIEPIELVYDGALISSKIESLPDDGSRYLLIPASGSLNEFNKFIHAVKTAMDASADNPRFSLFGYPDWTAFRNDAESLLHAVNATVFSRFYYDENSFDTNSFRQAFRRWYGDDMIDLVPNQAVLGFDIGNMLIRNLRANEGIFNPDDDRYVGIQSSFRFSRFGDSDNSGCYNDEIYILRFTPEHRVERLTF